MNAIMEHKAGKSFEYDFEMIIDVSPDSNIGVFRRSHVGNNPVNFTDPWGLEHMEAPKESNYANRCDYISAALEFAREVLGNSIALYNNMLNNPERYRHGFKNLRNMNGYNVDVINNQRDFHIPRIKRMINEISEIRTRECQCEN